MAGVLLIVLAYVGYTRFLPRKKASPLSQAPVALTESEVAKKEGIGGLKLRAVQAFNSNDFDAAWSHLSAARELDESDAEVWNDLGVVARRRGDLDASRKAYQRALDLKPDYPEALNNLAVLEIQEGSFAKGEELLKESLTLEPAYPEANFHLALFYDERGDVARAVQYYKKFVDTSSGFPRHIVEDVRDRIMEIEP